MRGSLSTVAFLLVVPTFIGCITASDELAPAPTQATPGPASDIRPELLEPTFLPAIRLGQSGTGAEPTIAVAPDDTIFVEEIANLWRSTDGGKTFEELGEPVCDLRPGGVDLPACPPGYEGKYAGLVGGGDGEIAVDANGTLYWAGLVGPDGYVQFQRSTDGGATWTEPFYLAGDTSSDREWIDARADGTLFASWRQFGDDASIVLRRSPDGGLSWDEPVRIGDDALAGPVVVDPSSEAVYLPYIDGGVKLARSLDDGATWDVVTAVEFAAQDFFATTIFPVAAVDAAGTVYLVWSRDDGLAGTLPVDELNVPRVFLSVSLDRGATWTDPQVISPEGHAAIFPWIAAGAPGRIAVAWYENENGLPSERMPDRWNVRLSQSVDADSGAPALVGGYANSEPFHVGGICSGGGGCTLTAKDRSKLDFFQVAIRPNGLPVVTWPSGGDPARQTYVQVWAGGIETGTPLT